MQRRDQAVCTALIVGDPMDAHVAAVTRLLPRAGVVVVDASNLPDVLISMGVDRTLLVDQSGEEVVLSKAKRCRGWVRRFAPAGWDEGTRLGSHRAAVLAARLGLLGAVLRDSAVDWLSPVDRLVAAENKMLQYRAAALLNMPFPPTVVAYEASSLERELGRPFLLKPIGPGNYGDDSGRQTVVYVRSVTAESLEGVDMAEAPFMAQRLLHAQCHLRVVTVGERAWVASLSADALPIDWRADMTAHHAFQSCDEATVSRSALALAQSLGVGYSSQDWIVEEKQTPMFLDLNPGGQWLFLPEDICQAVAKELADWLSNYEYE